MLRSAAETLEEKNDAKRRSIPVSASEVTSLEPFFASLLLQSGPSRFIDECISRDDHMDLVRGYYCDDCLPITCTNYKVRDIPPQVLFYCVNDPTERKAFDSGIVRFEVSSVIEENLDVIISEVSTPPGISNREFVEYRRVLLPKGCESQDARSYISYFRSCPDNVCSPGIWPKMKGVERAETWLSAYIFKWWMDENNKPVGSTLQIISKVDPRGSVPKKIPANILNRQARKWIKLLNGHSRSFCHNNSLNVSMSDQELDTKLGLNKRKTSLLNS